MLTLFIAQLFQLVKASISNEDLEADETAPAVRTLGTVLQSCRCLHDDIHETLSFPSSCTNSILTEC